MPFPIPDNLDFTLYFNIAFFSILGLGMFFGFLRGFKKSLYAFIVTVIFYVAFFLTIDLVINTLWTLNLPFLGSLLGNFLPELSGVTSFSELVPTALQTYFGDQFGDILQNERLLEFAAGLGMFALKIVYTIVYFTIIQIIYRFLTFLIRIIFFNTKKSERKYRSQNRGFGALFGLMSGVLSLYVTLIIFGGIISISESLLTFTPEDFQQVPVEMSFPRQDMYEASYSVIPLAEGDDQMAMLESALGLLDQMVSAYNANIIVTASNQVVIADQETETELPLNLYLFDSVLSFTYREQKVPLRNELSVYANVASTVMDSAFFASQDLSDISGDDIRNAFDLLSQSSLFTSLLPLTIEIGSEYLDTGIPIPVDQLYTIDWAEEVQKIGEVGALVFDFVNTAGVFNPDVNLDTVTFDGDDAAAIFTALGQSELVTLAAYTAAEPLLERVGGTIQAVITIPAEMDDWGQEIESMGVIIGAILNTEITLGDMQSGDPMLILQKISTLDFVDILKSKIITQALINILEGAGNLIPPDVLAFLDIPDGIRWLDEYNDDGELIFQGELHSILYALNVITTVVADVDFNNLGLNTIAELNLDSIDAIFDSEVLVASITKAIKNQDFGTLPLIIPDSVFEEDTGYIKKDELIHMVDALSIISTELVCDDGDEECQITGFDINKAFSLSSDSIDTVLLSDILWTTIGNMIMVEGADVLIIPDTEAAKTQIFVNEAEMYVVSRVEVSLMFQAVSTLGISGIDNLEIDASIITDIAADEAKVDTLLASTIVWATVGNLLYDMGSDVLTIPQSVIETVVADETEYSAVTASEIKNLLLAVSTLEIGNIETIDFGPQILKKLARDDDETQTILDEDKADQLLSSMIVHATLSDTLLDLANQDDPILIVPHLNQTGLTEIRYQLEGDDFEWIDADELKALIRAILLINIPDFESFSIDTLDLTSIIGNSTIILDSSILQATISDQIINLDAEMIIVPTYDELGTTQIVIDTDQSDTYILDTEIENALDAIQVLDLNLKTPNVDASLINNLALPSDDPDVRELDDGKLTILFSSSILQASLSDMILDFAVDTAEADAILVVPEMVCDPESNALVRVDNGHGTEFIAAAELKDLFKAFYAMNIDDFDNISIDTLDLDNIITNSGTILDSSILLATISDQIINLDAEMIIVPTYDDSGTIQIQLATDSGDNYILRSEVENALDAIQVLNLELSTPNVDASLIDNLALPSDDPNVRELDDDKLTTLFSSSILQASLSNMILDYTLDTETTTAVLKVPQMVRNEMDEDVFVRLDNHHGTEFITVAELTSLFKAYYALDIDDFNSVDSLNINDILGQYDILMDSATLYATISDQVINMESDTVVVPAKNLSGDDIIISVGEAGQETDYVIRSELKATFDALEVTGIDFNDPVFDATIIDNLALESEDPLVRELDDDKLDTLFASTIIHASISKMLYDLTQDTETQTAQIVVPKKDVLGVDIQLNPFGTDFIKDSELKNLLKALYALDITDFNNIDTLTLDNIRSNFDILIASAILHATISDQVINLESDAVVVPDQNLSGTDIVIYVGDPGAEDIYIFEDELRNTFDALDVLGINFNSPAFDASIINNLAVESEDPLVRELDDDKLDTLFASTIIHASISKMLFDLTVDTETEAAVLVVPFVDGTILENDVRIDPYGTEFITEIELRSTLKALYALDITTNFDQVDTLYLSDINANWSYIEVSAILQATISDQMLTLDSADVTIPYFDSLGNSIRKTVGDPGEETTYILSDELKNTFLALELLGVDDLNNVQVVIDLTDFYDKDNRDVLLASAIVHAAISQQVIDVGETLEVPYFDQAGNPIRVTEGDPGLETDTEYVVKDEIHAMFEVMEILEIPDLDHVDMTIDLTIFYDQAPRDILLASASVQLEISKQLLDIDDATLDIPFVTETGAPVRITRGDPLAGTESQYVTKDEINALFEVLDFLKIPDFNSVDITIQLSDLYVQENRDILLAPASVQLKVSSQMLALDDGALNIPDRNYADDQDVKIAVANPDDTIDDIYIWKQEIHNFFEGLEVLNLPEETDTIDQFGGDLSLTVLYEQENRTILYDSSIMHATLSKQIINLDDIQDKISVPLRNYDEDLQVKVTIGTDLYLNSLEIDAFFEGLEVLVGDGIDNIDDFTGTFDMNILYDGATRGIILDSAIMHATFSKQIIDLDDIQDKLIVPARDYDNGVIRKLVDTTWYVDSTEIDNLLEGIEVLEIPLLTDISGFPGTFDITKLYDENIRTTLLMSASIHATISDQIFVLDTTGKIVVPDYDIDGTMQVRKTVLAVEFINKTEIHNFFEAIETLGVDLDVIGDFTGTISLDNYFKSANPDTYQANQIALLNSVTMHATISKQMLDLEDDKLHVPAKDVDGVTIIDLTFGNYVSKAEIYHLIDALDLIGVGNIATFDGEIDITNIYDTVNQDTLLLSASMHATISDQIFGLDAASKIVIPDTNLPEPGEDPISTISNDYGTDFVIKGEVKALIEGLEILEIDNIDNFSGAFSLAKLADSGNQTTLLASAIMHATISDKIVGMDGSDLVVPATDFDGNPIQALQAGTNFLLKDEIKHLIDGLLLVGFSGSMTDFDGAISLVLLVGVDGDANQDKLLLSAIMHATISDTILSIDDAVIVKPLYKDDTTTAIRVTVSATKFVIKDEIKALINAFDVLHYDNLNSFGSTPIDTSLFFADPDTLLLSAMIQATISYRILTDASGSLLVPNTDIENGDADIRIVVPADGVEYIVTTEIKALLTALEMLGMTDFSTINITVGSMFNDPLVNFSTLVASASIQATISDSFLAYAIDEDARVAGDTDLCVPNYFRQPIMVGVDAKTQIEEDELVRMLDALKLLGFENFDDSVSSSVVTALTEANLGTILLSGSMHVTIDNMLKGNPNISVPDKAYVGNDPLTTLYDIAGLIQADEIKYFIVAAKIVGGESANFTSVDFDYSIINSLSPENQTVVLRSMLVRNMITPDLVSAVNGYNLIHPDPDSYAPIPDSMYEDNDNTTFLTSQAILDLIDYLPL